jgi:hypothetical protein
VHEYKGKEVESLREQLIREKDPFTIKKLHAAIGVLVNDIPNSFKSLVLTL